MNFCHSQKSFWPWIFPSDIVPFWSKKVGCIFGPWTTIQGNGSSLLCDVISEFHSPWNKHKQWEITKSIYFFILLTHSGQWSLKKGILCQVLRFCESILLLHPKTIHNSDQAFCKKRKLSLSVCACFVCEWNTEMKYKTN